VSGVSGNLGGSVGSDLPGRVHGLSPVGRSG
jgi:hypothetical protein